MQVVNRNKVRVILSHSPSMSRQMITLDSASNLHPMNIRQTNRPEDFSDRE